MEGWKEFHRVCGSRGLFFDHPVRKGRRQFGVDAFDTAYRLVATGTGETVLQAIRDAHDRSGRGDRETRLALDYVGATDDFDELLEV